MRQMDKKEAKGKISVEDVHARARKTKGRFQPSVSAKGLWTPGDWMQAKMPDEGSSDGSIEDLRNDFGMEPNSGEDSSQQQVSGAAVPNVPVVPTGVSDPHLSAENSDDIRLPASPSGRSGKRSLESSQ